MKFLIALLVATSSLAALARPIVECRTVEILDSSIFEESLSVEEYPLITFSQTGRNLELAVGANLSYKALQGDKIGYSTNGTSLVITAKYKDSKSTLSLEIKRADSTGKRWGELSYQVDGRYNFQAVALLLCR